MYNPIISYKIENKINKNNETQKPHGIHREKITSSKEINVEVHISNQMKYLGSKNEVFRSIEIFLGFFGELLKLLNMNLLGYTKMKLIVQVT